MKVGGDGKIIESFSYLLQFSGIQAGLIRGDLGVVVDDLANRLYL